MKKIFMMAFIGLLAMTVIGQEASKPYNPNADAKADLKKAIELAKKENKHVLIQIGGTRDTSSLLPGSGHAYSVH